MSSYRYKAILEYDGTGFHGWQLQGDQPTIQKSVEDAIYLYCGMRVNVWASGRTDAGVHALGQVIHFDLPSLRNEYKILSAINYHLKPAKIALIEVNTVSNNFHCRFDTKLRHYQYRIINRAARLALEAGYAWHISRLIDIERMKEGAQFLIGKHDFSSFRSVYCKAENAIRTMNEVRIEKNGYYINVDINARSFLHNQVRIIIGCLVEIGLHKKPAEYIDFLLRARDRKLAAQTAPAYGLYFMKAEF